MIGCQQNDRHCHSAVETNLYNIFNHSADNEGDQNNVDRDAVADCSIPNSSDKDGSYMMMQPKDNNLTMQQSRIIAFQYQIQTSLSVTELIQIGLPIIEKAISDVLVQHFFPSSSCSDRENRRILLRKERRQRRRRLLPQRFTSVRAMNNVVSWIGLHATPADSIVPGLAGVSCHSILVPNATSCFTMNGAYTIIYKDADDVNEQPVSNTDIGTNATTTTFSYWEETSKEIIKNAMNQKQLQQHFKGLRQNQIQDVQYISDDPATSKTSDLFSDIRFPKNNQPTSVNNVQQHMDTLHWPWIIVLIVIVIAILTVLIHVCLKRRYRQSDESDDQCKYDDSNRFHSEHHSLASKIAPTSQLARAAASDFTSPSSFDTKEQQYSVVSKMISNILSSMNAPVTEYEYGPFHTGGFPVQDQPRHHSQSRRSRGGNSSSSRRMKSKSSTIDTMSDPYLREHRQDFGIDGSIINNDHNIMFIDDLDLLLNVHNNNNNDRRAQYSTTSNHPSNQWLSYTTEMDYHNSIASSTHYYYEDDDNDEGSSRRTIGNTDTNDMRGHFPTIPDSL